MRMLLLSASTPFSTSSPSPPPSLTSPASLSTICPEPSAASFISCWNSSGGSSINEPDSATLAAALLLTAHNRMVHTTGELTEGAAAAPGP
ncbi:hypothetical protein COO60DRAFT_1495988 [Scenedesmus sp. NREL 46B-D3]|nr:hypothetical protein COO60DRAFT_1495988 [Scenedesmus sp. NREL 46B-D3]